jgi:hypothetical protein
MIDHSMESHEHHLKACSNFERNSRQKIAHLEIALPKAYLYHPCLKSFLAWKKIDPALWATAQNYMQIRNLSKSKVEF